MLFSCQYFPGYIAHIGDHQSVSFLSLVDGEFSIVAARTAQSFVFDPYIDVLNWPFLSAVQDGAGYLGEDQLRG